MTGGLASVAQAIRATLLTADPRAKVMATRKIARDWRLGRLAARYDVAMPDAPARPDRPELLPPRLMPKRKKAGSDRAKIALLHALAHIEFVAIDLALDLVGRFGGEMPTGFTDDWLTIASEEAMHFALVRRRLRSLGADYGDLPAHDGLWEAASDTRHDISARLAVVPMVLEARGLDVTPAMIDRFTALGDARSAAMLQRILDDEIGHVRAGLRWFHHCCAREDRSPLDHWQNMVKRHFRGQLKPPFNDSARQRAGLSRDFYLVGC
jgi:uncharacterized ferritin-like protein (DUF455 family)